MMAPMTCWSAKLSVLTSSRFGSWRNTWWMSRWSEPTRGSPQKNPDPSLLLLTESVSAYRKSAVPNLGTAPFFYAGLALWQRERNHIISLLGLKLPMSAGRDDHILLIFPGVRHGRRLCRRGQLVRPRLLARFRSERAQMRVHGRSRKHQPARRHHRASQVDRTRLLASQHRSQRHIPHDFATE